jgi:phosphoribosyl 1,2-cyclic phosphodiesterase
MRYCILASGSKGNSIFIESAYGRFLIDVGLSARKIEQRLLSRDIDPQTIDAIILTHAHSDHVRGVGVFANRFNLSIYAHPATLDHITHSLKPGQDIRPCFQRFQFKDLAFTPFRVSHDCDPTVGFLIQENSKTLGICTDLGVVTEEVKQHVRQANALLLESNHDPDMLMNGPYSWELKDRIAGRTGHLSNHNAGELLTDILHLRLQHVILGHLSEENNTPQIALETVLDYLGSSLQGMIDVIEQKTVSEMFTL